MIKYLFASHGKLAEGVKNSLELIMGSQKNVYTFRAYANDDNDVEKAIKHELATLITKNDSWIVVSDIFGGSVNNYLLENIKQYHYYLISGLSLPLALNLLTQINVKTKNISQGIEKAIADSKRQIIFCNKKLVNAQSNDNDF